MKYVCLPSLSYHSKCCNFSFRVFLTTYDKVYVRRPGRPGQFLGSTWMSVGSAFALENFRSLERIGQAVKVPANVWVKGANIPCTVTNVCCNLMKNTGLLSVNGAFVYVLDVVILKSRLGSLNVIGNSVIQWTVYLVTRLFDEKPFRWRVNSLTSHLADNQFNDSSFCWWVGSLASRFADCVALATGFLANILIVSATILQYCCKPYYATLTESDYCVIGLFRHFQIFSL